MQHQDNPDQHTSSRIIAQLYATGPGFPTSNENSQRRGRRGDRQDVFSILSLVILAYQSSPIHFICSIANHKVIDFTVEAVKASFFPRCCKEPLISYLLHTGRQIRWRTLKSFQNQYPLFAIPPMYHRIPPSNMSMAILSRKLRESAESQLFRARKPLWQHLRWKKISGLSQELGKENDWSCHRSHLNKTPTGAGCKTFRTPARNKALRVF